MKINFLYFFIIFITLILKLFFFYEFSVINEDDLRYIKISEAIYDNFDYKIITAPGHIFFPPGYPLILGFEKLVLKTWENVYLFNFLIISTLISFLTFLICKSFFSKYYHSYVFILIFLYPAFISSRSIFGTSSVIIFTFFLILSFYFSFLYFYHKKNYKYLFISNFLLCFSYLIRPEGLYFFIIFLLFQFYHLRFRIFEIKSFLTIILPISIFIIPYILFLYYETGILTFTYKTISYDYSVLRGNFFDNTFLLFNFIFSTPHLYNPIIILGLLLTFILIFTNYFGNIEKEKIIFIFAVPLIFMLLLAYRYALIGRVLYSTLPFFIILSSLGISFFVKKFYFIRKLVLSFILVFFIFSYSILFYQNIFSNHPILFKKAANYINKFDSTVYCVAGRDLKISHYLSTNKFILIHGNEELLVGQKNLKNCIPYYIILSNISHISLRSLSILEKENMYKTEFSFLSKNYKLIKTISRNKYFVKIYKY